MLLCDGDGVDGKQRDDHRDGMHRLLHLAIVKKKMLVMEPHEAMLIDDDDDDDDVVDDDDLL